MGLTVEPINGSDEDDEDAKDESEAANEFDVDNVGDDGDDDEIDIGEHEIIAEQQISETFSRSVNLR